MTPRLFTFRRCPYAIRARMALIASGVAFDQTEVALRDKPASLIAASPKGAVPVLVLADGVVIDESLDIMRWALAQDDPLHWLAGADSAEAADWLQRNDVQFKPLLDRYKYAERHPELTRAQHWALAVEAHITPLDALLQRQAFVLGDGESLVDVALFPFVRQFRGVDAAHFDAQPWPGLQRWLRHWLAHPVFERAMAKAG